MTKTLLAIRHVAFEDLGGFEEPLKNAGYAIRYFDIGMDDISAVGAMDLLLILGGPIGAYQHDLYPFLKDEIALIAERLDAGKPTLGICLGAQLMACALGARVYPSGTKELGWKTLLLTDAGERVLGPLKNIPVLHWHGDTFDLPKGAVNLASTDTCHHQAFLFGRHAMAFQFHPEAQLYGIERWLIGHTGEIAATPGVSVAALRADTERFAAVALPRGQTVLRNWLDQLP